MSLRNRHELERQLRELRAPAEAEAAERSLAVVRRAPVSRHPSSPSRTRRLRLAAAVAVGSIVAVGLTPAGASVRDWISETVAGVEDDQPTLARIPTSGRVLATSPGGTWILDEDGSRHRLGSYRDATWSPGGLYVASARGRLLAALDQTGDVRWSISSPGPVSDPGWAPTGLRIAYRSGGDLRLVEGDGSDDKLLAHNVAPIAAAWRPPPAGVAPASHVLAYVERNRQVVVRDVESGIETRASPGVAARFVSWLAHDRLVVAGKRWVNVLDRDLGLIATFGARVGSTIDGVAVSPSTGRVAFASALFGKGPGVSSELVSVRIADDGTTHSRTLFAGPGRFSGLTFSPNGLWLLAGWRDADQWLFLRPAADRKLLRSVVAFGDISRQFDPRAEGGLAFPQIEGWCCEE